MAETKRADDADLIFNQIGWIHVSGQFDNELVDIIKPLIFRAKQNQPEVRLLIDSDGGFLTSLTSISTVLTLSGLPTVGLVLGRAKSAAFLLLQYCDQRLAMPGSFLLPHWGHYQLNNNEVAALIRGETWPTDMVRSYTKAHITQTHLRSGQDVDKLAVMFDQERLLPAQLALEYGFIDEIVAPKDVPKLAVKKAK